LWKVMMRLLQAMGGDLPAVSLAEVREQCERLIPGSGQAWDGSEIDSWLMPASRNRKAVHYPAQQLPLKPLDIVSRYSMYREGTWARASSLLVDAGRLHAMADLIVHPKTLKDAGFAPGDAVTIRTYRGVSTYHLGVRDDVSEGVLFISRRGVAGELSSDSEAEMIAAGGDT